MTNWLHELRLEAAQEAVRESGASTILDLGCGDGDLLTRLAAEPQVEQLVGIDLCRDSLARLRERLEGLKDHAGAQVQLVHGSIMESGTSFRGYDCAVLIETIEHIDPERLSSLEEAVFTGMRPRTIVVTTPNAEFNALLGVPPHRFRHPDHRFEWDRARFQRWALGVAARRGYRVVCKDIAGCHPQLGGASQMAVFTAAARAGAPLAA